MIGVVICVAWMVSQMVQLYAGLLAGPRRRTVRTADTATGITPLRSATPLTRGVTHAADVRALPPAVESIPAAAA